MKIAILGWEEGLAGQVSTWLESELGHTICCYVHPENEMPQISAKHALQRPAKKFSYPRGDPLQYRGLPLLTGEDWPLQVKHLGTTNVASCLSDPNVRKKAFEQGVRESLLFPPFIHPSAQILAEAELGAGVIIEPNCYVGYRAEVGVCTHMHAGSQLDHHSVLGSFTTLLPGAIVAGNALVRSASVIGMGALVANRVELGERSFVGAGSTVLQSFTKPGQKLLGTPASPR